MRGHVFAPVRASSRFNHRGVHSLLMIRRLTLLLVVMAIPVLTALGTQQLARTTAPPTLPTDPVTSHTSESSEAETDDDATDGPRSGSVAAVIPGSVDEDGEVTDPGMGSGDGSATPTEGASDGARSEETTTESDESEEDDDDLGNIDDSDEQPETGTVQR